ncbi:MAG TPA: cupin domain-containing protein [Acetobacteraceae bacterium]
MNDQPTTAPAMSVTISRASDPQLVEGRRAFFTYRDLGVTDGTGGRMRAQITAATAGMSRPTGWHRHICDMQFVFVLDGWLELEFAGRDTVRLEKGDSVMIPGGTAHNELGTSDSFELLEVSVPARMGTEPCDPPAV